MSSLDAVFLDRDGVLNRAAARGDYIRVPEQLELLPGAGDAVRLLNDRGIPVFVVTNQRGVSLGVMSAEDLDRVHLELRRLLSRAGARLDAIYHCPHPLNSCTCRKPETGLFERAQRENPHVRLTRTVVVGDSDSDIAAARRIGARAILISESCEEGIECASSLLEAVTRLLDQEPA